MFVLKFPGLSAALAAILMGGPALSQTLPEGAYLRVFGGATQMIGDGDETGPVAGAAIGTRASPGSPWRAEIEASRRESGDVQATGLMVNVLRDVGAVGPARIYAGLGAGAMRVEAGGDDGTNAAGQALLGAGFEIGRSAEFTLELRYVNAGDAPDTSESADAEWADVTAGFVFNF